MEVILSGLCVARNHSSSSSEPASFAARGFSLQNPFTAFFPLPQFFLNPSSFFPQGSLVCCTLFAHSLASQPIQLRRSPCFSPLSAVVNLPEPACSRIVSKTTATTSASRAKGRTFLSPIPWTSPTIANGYSL